MAFNKITAADLQGKGNVGKPDTPGYSTAEMQRVMDEIPREVIVPAFNALVDALENQNAAGSSGAQIPATLPDGTAATVQGVLDALAAQSNEHIENKDNPHEVKAAQVGAEIPAELPQDTDAQVQAILNAAVVYTRNHKQDKDNPHDVQAMQIPATVPDGLPQDTDAQVQAILNALLVYARAHVQRTDNPHGVTAAQVDAYTKKQTDDAINQKVTEIGSGDMAKAIYDPTGQERDIFADINSLQTEVDSTAQRYTATFTASGWTSTTTGGYAYTQTASLTPVKEGAPAITADSVFLAPFFILATGTQATDETLQEALGMITSGYSVASAGTVTTLVAEKPSVDITVYVTATTM